MRTCPVCHATSFDDVQTCFSCMHRFEDDTEVVFEEPAIAEPPKRVEIPLVEPVVDSLLDPFMDTEPVQGKHVALRQRAFPQAGQARYELVVSLQPVIAETLALPPR